MELGTHLEVRERLDNMCCQGLQDRGVSAGLCSRGMVGLRRSVRQNNVGQRTSLDVVGDLVPSQPGSAQLDPIVHICVQTLRFAMEFEQRGYTNIIALRSELATLPFKSQRNALLLLYSFPILSVRLCDARTRARTRTFPRRMRDRTR